MLEVPHVVHELALGGDQSLEVDHPRPAQQRQAARERNRRRLAVLCVVADRVDELDQSLGQIGFSGKLGRPSLGMPRERCADRDEACPRRPNVPVAVPGPPEGRERRCRIGCERSAIAAQERVELQPVRVLRLRIDMPDEWSGRPLAAHERVLAANEVDLAAPQQPVVVVLGNERCAGKRERAANDSLARARRPVPDPAIQVRAVDAFRNDAHDRDVASGPGVKQAGKASVRVAEERDHETPRIGLRDTERAPQRFTRAGIGSKTLAARDEIALAEQSAARRREARKEEIARQRQRRVP